MVAFPSPLPALLPDPIRLRLDEVVHEQGVTVLTVSVVGNVSQCPMCGTPSTRIHSWYTRALRDLPWHGTEVRMHLRTSVASIAAAKVVATAYSHKGYPVLRLRTADKPAGIARPSARSGMPWADRRGRAWRRDLAFIQAEIRFCERL
jgi:hypothetical protein